MDSENVGVKNKGKIKGLENKEKIIREWKMRQYSSTVGFDVPFDTIDHFRDDITG